MFEQQPVGLRAPSFNKGAGKSVIDRLNMGRLYVFNLFGAAAMLLMAALFRILKVYLLAPDYQTLAFVLCAVCMLLCAGMVFFCTKTHRKELFDKLCLGYIGVFSSIFYCFAFRSVNDASMMIFYSVIILTVSIVPLLKTELFACVFGAELIPLIILGIVKHFTAGTIISVIMISAMGVMLSMVIYSNTLRKLNYKLSLDYALEQAETDPMTMLLNRRGLDRRLEDVWPHCTRQRSKVAVLMLDIDNFKKYNDAFGHAAGDECIKAVTSVIRKSVKRKTDYAARVGGEEFLVLLTGIEPKQAAMWAVELQKAVCALKLQQAPSNFLPIVTVSMGLACSAVDDRVTFEQLREEADKSLYDSKYNGRAALYYRGRCLNRYSVYPKKKAGNE